MRRSLAYDYRRVTFHLDLAEKAIKRLQSNMIVVGDIDGIEKRYADLRKAQEDISNARSAFRDEFERIFGVRYFDNPAEVGSRICRAVKR